MRLISRKGDKMRKLESQNDKILRYLKTHKRGLTPYEALEKFDCMRLSGRIKDLRNQGVLIRSERVEVLNKKGKKCWVAKYTLVEK